VACLRDRFVLTRRCGAEVATQFQKGNGVDTLRDVGYWRDVVAAEYEDLPTLSVTFPQAMRLWGLDEVTCRSVLDSFIESGYLMRTHAGQYRRADYT
jgi:hypothetical protein